MTPTATAAWPTAEELHEVERLLADVSNAAEEVKMQLDDLVNIETAPSHKNGLRRRPSRTSAG